MALEETNNANRIMIDQSKRGVVLFKNVRGLFYTLDKIRKVMAGLLMPGASDLVGYKSVIVTPEMVGKKVAIICVIEVKTENGINRKTETIERQKHFCETVVEAGGYGGLAVTEDDARQITNTQ